MAKSRIFGTPPEPIFNLIGAGLAPELLEESLLVLVGDNDKQMDDINDRQGLFKEGRSAECIFLICQQLNLPPETRFLGVEIFDKFMAAHVSSLYDQIRNASLNNQQKDWKDVEARIKTQMPLRAVSCVQIASKLTSYYKAISCNVARRLLHSMGIRYKPKTIVDSEIRVLKTLKYKVMVTSPLTFLEILLEILGYNDSTSQVKLLHDVGLKILDVVYLQRNNIYQELLMVSTGTDGSKDARRKIAVLSSDFLLLAVAVISAGSYIIDEDKGDRVMRQLSEITQTPVDDILDFASILVETCL